MTDTDRPDAAPTSAAPASAGADDAATPGVDEVLGREVALVALPPTSGQALTARVEAVRGLAGLHHPHLPEIFDVDGLEAGAESVLVLERVPGRSLADLRADGPLPSGRVAEIGARIASALAHAHAHGVVHGHLGPASVVVDDEHHVWLVGLTAGMRPEVARAPGVVSPDPAAGSEAARADDVRALAATLVAVVDAADDVDAGGATELAGLLGDLDGVDAAGLSTRLLHLVRRHAASSDRTAPLATVPAPRGATDPPPAPATAAPAPPEPRGSERHRRRFLASGRAVRSGGGAASASRSGTAASDHGRRRAAVLVATAVVAVLAVVLASGLAIRAQENGTPAQDRALSAPIAAPASPSGPPAPDTATGDTRSSGDGTGTRSVSGHRDGSATRRGPDATRAGRAAPATVTPTPVPPASTTPVAPRTPAPVTPGRGTTTTPGTTTPGTTTPGTTTPGTTVTPGPTTPGSSAPATPSPPGDGRSGSGGGKDDGAIGTGSGEPGTGGEVPAGPGPGPRRTGGDSVTVSVLV